MGPLSFPEGMLSLFDRCNCWGSPYPWAAHLAMWTPRGRSKQRRRLQLLCRHSRSAKNHQSLNITNCPSLILLSPSNKWPPPAPGVSPMHGSWDQSFVQKYYHML
jgi:hypothetical protein